MRTRTLGASALLPMGALAIVGLFGFQNARVVAASIAVALVELRGVSGGIATVVVVAVGALSFIAVPILQGSSRGRILVAVGLAATLRLALQLIGSPLVALVVAAIGLALALVLIGMAAVTYGGRVTGTALLLGASFDIALMAGRRTLDLTRSQGAGALIVIAGLGLAAVFSVWLERQATGPRRYGQPVPAAGLFLVGPWFALHLLLTGNVGVIGAISGAPLSVAAGAALAGSIGALGWAAPGRVRAVPLVSAAVVAAGLGLVVGADGGWALLLIAVVAMAAGATLTGSLERESVAPSGRLGWSLAAGTSVAYMVVAAIEASIDLPLGLSNDLWYPVLGLIVVGGATVSSLHRWESSQPWVTPPIIGLAFLLVPAWLWIGDPDTPKTDRVEESAVADDAVVVEEFIVATYNLNHGFDPGGSLGLVAISEALEETAWDVAGVQEISRGRLRDGGLDMVAWLEHELGLDIYWQASGSRLTGNALMSAFEVTVANPVDLETSEGRAETAIDATVSLPGVESPVRVLVVGLTEPTVELLKMLLESWQSSPSTVILGDFGSRDATDDPLDIVVEAGFYDVASIVDGSPATYPSGAPTEQRDKILISRDLLPSAVRIIESTASDHLAVVARIELAPLAE